MTNGNGNLPGPIADAVVVVAKDMAGHDASEDEILGAQLDVLVNNLERNIDIEERDIVDRLLNEFHWSMKDVARTAGLGYKATWGRWGRKTNTSDSREPKGSVEGLTLGEAWTQTGIDESATRRHMNEHPDASWHREGRIVDLRAMRIAVNGADGSTPIQAQHVTGIDRELIKKSIEKNPDASWHTKAKLEGGIRTKTLVTDIDAMVTAVEQLRG